MGQLEVIDYRTWAEQEFGHTELGHKARTNRLIEMAARMIEKPHGQITRMFTAAGERQAAYDLLSNPHIKTDKLNVATTIAAVKRAANFERVYVAIDGTSLTLDSTTAPGLSEIGGKKSAKTGLHIQNSIVMSDCGQVLGVGHQEFYQRVRRLKYLSRAESRVLPFEEKESRYWLDCVRETEKCFVSEGVLVHRTYLMDAGADVLQILEYAHTAGCRVIIRSCQNRVLVIENDVGEKVNGYLKKVVTSAPIKGDYELTITGVNGRKARTATIQVQSDCYTIRLTNYESSREISHIKLWIVRAHEISPVPDGEKPIEWHLFCNEPVETREQAVEVISAYTRRWRIEEMHRCLKTVCGVEHTRLRSITALTRFAMIMSSVATRIEQLKTTSRAEPDAPATRLFSHTELKVLILLHFSGVPPDDTIPTCGQAVCWLAQMGGYIGPHNGPPGQETIGRGLVKLQNVMDFHEIISELNGFQCFD